MQSAKFSGLLQQALIRYRNRTIETAQVIEELIEMAKKFQEAAVRRSVWGFSQTSLPSTTPAYPMNRRCGNWATRRSRPSRSN